MKRSELIFNIISIPVDAISLILAALMSFYIRLNLAPHFPVLFTPNIHVYIREFIDVMPILLGFFALAGLYNLRGTRKFTTEFGKIFASISIALLVIVFVFFFNQNFFNSRLIILIAWPTSILFVVIGRFILKRIQALLLNKGLGLHNLVIIAGDIKQHNLLLKETVYHKKFGYNIVAEISYHPEVVKDLEEMYAPEKFEEILQANPLASAQINEQILQFARKRGLVFNYIPNLFDVQMHHVETDHIRGVPIISIKNTPLSGWGSVLKRVFDILVSLICLIITSPLFLLIALAIKIDSRGKVFYRAARGGYKKDFTFYKFRTMFNHLSVGEEYGGARAEKVRQELWKSNARGGESAAFLKIKDDPRVTRVGKFLRKTKLDEIPQFINVLKGDMSMVGPRAHVIEEVERYRDEHRRIFSIKPGIFGLSQLAQLYWPDLPFEEEIRLNTYYIENWSLRLDITVLAKSFYNLFFASKPNEDY